MPRPRQPSLPDPDDWFDGPPDEPDAQSFEVVWQDDREPEPSLPPADGLGRRQAIVVLAALAAIILGAGGILIVRALAGSDSKSAATTTASVPTATTPTTTTPTTSTPTTTTPGTTPTPTPSPSGGAVPTGTTLRPGASGDAVKALQQALIDGGFPAGTVDGNYGAVTQKAVTAFQTANGLVADGIAGPKTIAALNAAVAKG